VSAQCELPVLLSTPLVPDEPELPLVFGGAVSVADPDPTAASFAFGVTTRAPFVCRFELSGFDEFDPWAGLLDSPVACCSVAAGPF
jgi:hypothetical protein